MVNQDKITELKILAEKNDKNAQFELAQIYFYGRDSIKEDESEAFYWFRKAAINGHIEAFEFLQCKATNHPIIPIASVEFVYCLFMLSDNEEHKNKLIKIASSESDLSPMAELYLGQFEFKKQNYKEAFSYLKQAISKGYAEALDFIKEQAEKNNLYSQETLGEIYLDGLGIETDRREAFKWYAQAVKNGSEKAFDIINKYANREDDIAKYELANIYYVGTQKIKQNYKEAFSLYLQIASHNYQDSENIINSAISNNDQYAQYVLGKFYEENNKICEAFDLLIKSANQGNTDAIKYLKNFAENGSPSKQYEVAKLIENNNLLKQEYLQYLELYKKSAENGNILSIQRLAEYYHDNDKNLSIAWYLKLGKESVEQKINISANTARILGEIYLNDTTKPWHKAKGLIYYLQSAKSGDKQAKNFIKNIDIESLNDTELKILGEKYYYGTNNLKIYLFTKKHIIKRIIKLIGLTMLFLVIIVPLSIYIYIPKGTDFEKAKIYYKRGNINKAEMYFVRYYVSKAEKGNVLDQYKLGMNFYTGKDSAADPGRDSAADIFPRDYQKARYWFEKAAEQGHAHAQFLLGYMYYEGLGVERDYQKTLYWLGRAAEGGDLEAQHTLGKMYFVGEGVERDYQKALYWFEKAAQQGDAIGQYNLGYMYYNGLGVDRDYKKAIEWFEKAAQQGNSDSQYILGDMYYNGLGEQDYQKALYWFEKFEEKQDNVDVQYNLGYMYYIGLGTKQDFTKALYWFEKAAEQGHSHAKFLLGMMYSFGKGVQPNNQNALYWIMEAAAGGDWNAQNELASMYLSGLGVERDLREGLYWFEKAQQNTNRKFAKHLIVI